MVALPLLLSHLFPSCLPSSFLVCPPSPRPPLLLVCSAATWGDGIHGEQNLGPEKRPGQEECGARGVGPGFGGLAHREQGSGRDRAQCPGPCSCGAEAPWTCVWQPFPGGDRWSGHKFSNAPKTFPIEEESARVGLVTAAVGQERFW